MSNPALPSQRVRVGLASNQTLNNATPTAIAWTSEQFDSGFHDVGENPSRLTAPVAGMFQVVAFLCFAANATGIRRVDIYKNGSPWSFAEWPNLGSGNSARAFIFDQLDLDAGDFIEIYGYQDRGGTLDVQAPLAGQEVSFAIMNWLRGGC